MAKVNSKSEMLAREARTYNTSKLPRPSQFKKPVQTQSSEEAPAYLVSVTSRPLGEDEKSEPLAKDPTELRAKAASVLGMGILSPEQEQALQRALTSQEMDGKNSKS